MYKMNKDLMLSRHQNWYIRKNLCLAHSKFPTAVEAFIAVCFLSLLLNKRRIIMHRRFEGGVY